MGWLKKPQLPETMKVPEKIRDPKLVRELHEELDHYRHVISKQVDMLRETQRLVSKIHPENMTPQQVLEVRRIVLEMVMHHIAADEAIFTYFTTIGEILDIFVDVGQTSKNIESFIRRLNGAW